MMKHDELSKKVSALIDQIQGLHDEHTPQAANDRFDDAVCELQDAIEELQKDADASQGKAH